MTKGQEQLRRIMTERSLTQAQVGEALDAGGDLVSRWLEEDPAKRRTKPSLEMAGRLPDKFGIDPLDWGREADTAPESERNPTPGKGHVA